MANPLPSASAGGPLLPGYQASMASTPTPVPSSGPGIGPAAASNYSTGPRATPGHPLYRRSSYASVLSGNVDGGGASSSSVGSTAPQILRHSSRSISHMSNAAPASGYSMGLPAPQHSRSGSLGAAAAADAQHPPLQQFRPEILNQRQLQEMQGARQWEVQELLRLLIPNYQPGQQVSNTQLSQLRAMPQFQAVLQQQQQQQQQRQRQLQQQELQAIAQTRLQFAHMQNTGRQQFQQHINSVPSSTPIVGQYSGAGDIGVSNMSASGGATLLAGAVEGSLNVHAALSNGPGYGISADTAIGGDLSKLNSAYDRPAAAQFFVPAYLASSQHLQRLQELHQSRLKAPYGASLPHFSPENGASGNGGTGTNSGPGTSFGAGTGVGPLPRSASSISLPSTVHTHRGMAHDVIERPPAYLEDGSPATHAAGGSSLAAAAAAFPLPSRWNELDKFPGIEILADGCEVRFAGSSKPASHAAAAAVRADHPMPRQCGIYYYEVTILSRGKESPIGIGFSGPKVPLNRLPGWELESWAYHGDDGFSFCCTASGKDYGPKFSAMDVIGCGVNFRTGSAFFTKNGDSIGTAFGEVKSDRLYPSVGMKKPGEHIRVNFGQSPFVFDIESLFEAEKLAINDELRMVNLTQLCPPLEEDSLVQELVAQYLAQEGYVETARAFTSQLNVDYTIIADADAATRWPVGGLEDPHIANRQRIKAAILEGNVDLALELTTSFYPSVLRDNENIYFKLRCRKFIEMIRNCNELQSSTTATSLRKREQYSKNGQSRRRSRSVRFKKKRHHVRQKSPEHVFEHGKHHVYEHEDDNAPENPDGEEAEGVFDQRMDLDDQQDYNDYSPNDRHRPHRHEHGVTDAHYHNRKTAAEKASFPIQGVIDQDNDDDDWQSSDQMDTEDVFSSADLTARYSSLMQETIQYGQELQAEFSGDPRREVKRALEDTFALIAYTDARQSSLAPLLEVAGRVPVAEELNGAILISLGKAAVTALERACQQTEVLLHDLAEDGGQGAFVNLSLDVMR